MCENEIHRLLLTNEVLEELRFESVKALIELIQEIITNKKRISQLELEQENLREKHELWDK